MALEARFFSTKLDRKISTRLVLVLNIQWMT